MYGPAERFVREKDLQHGPANLEPEERDQPTALIINRSIK